MKSTDTPTKISVPFASTGTKNTIPVASQIGITDGLASFTDGFVPLNFTALTAGGVPPFGADFNGILYALSNLLLWKNSGGGFTYDSTVEAAIGGYPKGAVLLSATADSFWISNIDDNTTDPDSGVSSDWTPIFIGQRITSLTATATLTTSQAGIILVDASSANVTLTLPSASSMYGLPYTIIRTDSSANTVAFTRAGSDSIGGATSISIISGGAVSIISDGSAEWWPISQNYTFNDGRYAAIAGNSAQAFSVAAASSANEAINYSQSFYGATYHNVYSSRSIGPTYTNSHGKPMLVVVSVSTTGTCEGAINGNNITAVSNTGYSSIVLLVPPGGSYDLLGATGTSTVGGWVEYY